MRRANQKKCVDGVKLTALINKNQLDKLVVGHWIISIESPNDFFDRDGARLYTSNYYYV